MAAAIEDLGGQLHLVIDFQQQIGADEVDLGAQHSTSLITWADDPVYVGRVNNGDGTSSVRFRSSTPVAPGGREFLRILGSSKP